MFSTRTFVALATLLAVILVTTGSALAEKEPREHQPRGLAIGKASVSTLAERETRESKVHQQTKRRVIALHGEIKAIAGTMWTVSTEHRGDVSVDVSGADVKWPSRPNATLADFIVGDHVNVRLGKQVSGSPGGTPTPTPVGTVTPGPSPTPTATATATATVTTTASVTTTATGVSTSTTTTSTAFRALAVHFVPGRSLARFRGDVTAVSATSVTVMDQEGGSKTFTINAAATIRESDMLVSAAQIKVGSHVTVVSRKNADLALIIAIRGLKLDKFRGDVTAVSSTSITVMDEEGGSKTFTIDANTAIREAGKTISAADVKAGDHAMVGSQEHSTLAVAINVRPALSLFRGVVTAVSSNSLTVMDREGGSATFTLNSSTAVKSAGHAATIADVKVGDRVMVTAHKGDNTALSLLILDQPVAVSAAGSTNASARAGKLRAQARDRD